MKINIGYFADGPWSHYAFEKLVEDDGITFSFICVRFDTIDSTLKEYCEKYKIDYLKDKNINSPSFLSKISEYKCDLFISLSFNQIFKKEIINIPTLKTINCHAGKLPFYRGRNVLNWVLINDENEFGITIHFIDEGIDTGDIILQELFKIEDVDNYSTILKTAYTECANILYKAIILFKTDKVIRIPQKDIHPVGFYCSDRRHGDEILDWNAGSRDIFSFIRAVCKPAPMATSYIRGNEIKINKSKIIKNAPNYKGVSGSVIGKDDEGCFIKTLDSFIKITEYYYDGELKIGDRLEAK